MKRDSKLFSSSPLLPLRKSFPILDAFCSLNLQFPSVFGVDDDFSVCVNLLVSFCFRLKTSYFAFIMVIKLVRFSCFNRMTLVQYICLILDDF
ncbi:hypothetical protein SLEP1_g18869 [Rubroshorea leprosula]|uniref:Uncharacterized protein n=1 Tax=Rubroshorea leprosula TaxID=152421 RepID=A0AAV5J4U1_9ROSI|nr:hypothetical protein SLEP1_g18869 [Rubroshorea leprosula]